MVEEGQKKMRLEIDSVKHDILRETRLYTDTQHIAVNARLDDALKLMGAALDVMKGIKATQETLAFPPQAVSQTWSDHGPLTTSFSSWWLSSSGISLSIFCIPHLPYILYKPFSLYISPPYHSLAIFPPTISSTSSLSYLSHTHISSSPLFQ